MRSTLVILALIAAGVAATQTGLAQTTSPAPSAPSQPQAGAATQPPKSTHAPEAKSREEYDAYQAAWALTDPAKLEAAADDFAKKYPTSEVRAQLYIKASQQYQQANNAEKVIEAGRKAIAIDPTNPVPLVNVASALAETTHDSDLDRDQRLAEASKDAHAAIDNINNLQIPPNTPEERVTQVKSSILSMSYDTLGVVDMDKKEFAAAEQNLIKAADAIKDQPEGVIYLRLSVTQDNLKKYPEALESANKAARYSPEGSAEQNLAKQQQARVQKLISAQGTGSQGASPPPSSPAPDSATPAASGTQPPPQPH